METERDIAADTFLARVHPVFRWILLAPGAIAASLLLAAVFYFGITYGYSYSHGGEPLREGSFWYHAASLAQSGVFAFLFVLLGAAIAPKYQLMVAAVLLALVSALGGIAWYIGDPVLNTQIETLHLVAGLVGAVVGVSMVVQGLKGEKIFQ